MLAFERQGAQCDLGAEAGQEASGSTTAASGLQAAPPIGAGGAPPFADSCNRTAEIGCNRGERAPAEFVQVDALFLSRRISLPRTFVSAHDVV